MSIHNFNVVLCVECGLNVNEAEQVKALFDRHPGPVTASVFASPISLEKNGMGDSLVWADIFSSIEELRQTEGIPPETCVVVLTKTENELNWYAGQDENNMRNGFGHVDDFSWVTSAPNYAIIAHYVLKGLYNALINEAGFDWRSMWHEEPRGCFFDFCQDKTELNFKLRTADICGDCLPLFQSIGIPNELILQTVRIGEEVRRMAVNTSPFLPAEDHFSGWPFPVAVTRHKIVQASNSLMRFMLLLDHFDSLVRYFYLANETVNDRPLHLVERPSLGWWVRKLTNSVQHESQFAEAAAIAQQEQVVDLRNAWRGHGWIAMDQGAYDQEAQKLQAVLERIESELRPFLEKFQLVIPLEIKAESGQYVLEGVQLQGSHMFHPPFRQVLNADPITAGVNDLRQVYVTERSSGKYRSMWPFIRRDNCPSCAHERVLITDGGNQYIDVLIGHRAELDN